MAEILPIRPWRYNPEVTPPIDTLTSPLFDVVSEKQRKALYQNPLNSIHLSVPEPPNASDRAAALLKAWKTDHVLLQDKLPAIYVYYQYFKLAGSPKEYCRKGFIAHIRAYDWEDQVILRHENTIPKAVNDRIELLEKTELHVNPTHGLFTDPDFTLEKYMDEAIQFPLYETEDYQGVRDVMAVIHDGAVIRRFMEVMESKTIILADGHHRYEGSLIYKHKQMAANPHHRGNEGYNFHLMYFTNTEAGDLRILPTHRVITGLPGFDETEILRKLEKYFVIKPADDPCSLDELIMGKSHAFGLLFRDSAYKVRLRPEVLATMTWPFPDPIKTLDLTVMHYFIIEKVLGIPGKEQRASEYIDFDRSFPDCLKRVVKGEADMAIITNEVSIEEVKEVCHSGYTMPQKSTYFYPKVVGGFLFTSIHQGEFELPVYGPF
ncbi:DUF1015 domain-containing protein [Chryseolinea soli]|uniref:DUF1015 domain-containing protein n=1 Tax=Chryseolinea soli TaxID=2321403 RepID=A0A385SZL4_9BACT|nr:DUF1015 domain-containing protein [Chryseolinea soli]AYB34208.1 DUF1015 domain-containing protein [Chryseolinea soli]